MDLRSRLLPLLTALAMVALRPIPGDAGCGCEKAPPDLAPIRPASASAGDVVSLFAPGLEVGVVYAVRFGETGDTVVNGPAVVRRDFADGVAKPQIVVPLPELPLGPTGVRVAGPAGVVLEVPADDFTVLQRPLKLTPANGLTIARCYHAAVASDGTVHFPVDISAIADRMVFSGVAKGGYPLTFGPADVSIYNGQGVLMQLLGPDQAGIYQISDADTEPAASPDERGPSSFRLTYDRHEFLTYRRNHATDPALLLDPSDPNWHVDGTRHIDHDHLVVVIRGLLKGAAVPTPGPTPPFVFKVETTLPDSPAGHRAVTVIKWTDDCSHKPPSECDESSGECMCSTGGLASCAGTPMPRRITKLVADGCSFSSAAEGATGRRAERLAARALTRWRRAVRWLERPAMQQRLGGECTAALATALEAATQTPQP